MDDLQNPMDLQLWLNEELIRRQNLLKDQFIHVFKEVGNSFLLQETSELSSKVTSPKISRGNDLNGLPYQVLDLIRDFDTMNGANIRILNWFGVGCFITVLLGKDRENPIPSLLKEGFFFGLSENQWNYPDLILNKNQTDDLSMITCSNLGFHHWIKDLKVAPDLKTNIETFSDQIKIISAILKLAGQQNRN